MKISTSIPVTLVVFLVALVYRNLYNDRIRAESSTKLLGFVEQYMDMLPDDQREEYFINMIIDKDYMLTEGQRK